MAVETKWTKEPWSVREGELFGDPYFEIVAPNDSIAGEKVVLQTIVGDKRYPEHTAIERANATVAGAAPTLYDALASTICWACQNRIGWSGDMADVPTDGRTNWKTCHACAPARSALSNARGEA